MADVESGLPLGVLAACAAVYVVAYLLRRAGVVANLRQAQTAVTVVALAVAVFVGVQSYREAQSESLSALAASIAVAVLVWLGVGLLLAIPAAMGVERAEKRMRSDKDKPR